MVPTGMPSSSCARTNTSFHSRASRWISVSAGRSTGPRRCSISHWALWKKYSPKSTSDAGSGSPSTLMCFSAGASRAAGPRSSGSSRRPRVLLALAVGEVDPAARCASYRFIWPSMMLRPARRGGVLEVGHPHLRAGVERVDRHLPVGGPVISRAGRPAPAPAGRPASSGPRGSPGLGQEVRVSPSAIPCALPARLSSSAGGRPKPGPAWRRTPAPPGSGSRPSGRSVPVM